MLDRFAANAHRVGIFIEPFLHGPQHMLMLSARDPARADPVEMKQNLKPGMTVRLVPGRSGPP
jgi:hypothetical protein